MVMVVAIAEVAREQQQDEEEIQVTLVIWSLFLTSVAQHTSWERVVILLAIFTKR